MAITAIPQILPFKALGAKIALQEMIDQIRAAYERAAQEVSERGYPEPYMRQRLAELHRDYLRECEPIVRQLVKIAAIYSPTTWIVTPPDTVGEHIRRA